MLPKRCKSGRFSLLDHGIAAAAFLSLGACFFKEFVSKSIMFGIMPPGFDGYPQGAVKTLQKFLSKTKETLSCASIASLFIALALLRQTFSGNCHWQKQ